MRCLFPQNGGGSVTGSWSQLITGGGCRVKLVSYSVTGPRVTNPGPAFAVVGFAVVGFVFVLVALGSGGVVSRFAVAGCPEVDDASTLLSQGARVSLSGSTAKVQGSMLGGTWGVDATED